MSSKLRTPDAEGLRGWLQAHPSDEAMLPLTRADASALLQEIRRLEQSTDRLRKQNKKLRGRIGRLRGGAADDEE